MSGIDVALPLGALAKPVIMGCPWHGRIENGEMHLPNGTTRAWPQPENGDTKLIALDGIPPITRTPEQFAADVAAGREWLAVAILSGIDNQLYGRPLGRNAWIWQDAAGDRWKVSIANLSVSDFAAGLDTRVLLERFGAYGAPAELHELALVLPDIGQTAPIVKHFVPFVGLEPIQGGAARVLDATRTGHRVIVEIYSTSPYISKPKIHEFGPSMGYLEIALVGAVRAGSATATASVLRSRAETIGVAAVTSSDTRQMWGAQYLSTTTTEGVCPADGYRTITTTATGVDFIVGGEGAYQDGEFNGESSVAGRIVAMWYRDDVAAPIVYEMTHVYSNATTLSGAGGGTTVTIDPCDDGPSTTSGELWYSITQTFMSAASVTARLLVGGIVVDEIAWTMSQSGSRTYHSAAGFSGGGTVALTQNEHAYSYEVDPESLLYPAVASNPWWAMASSYGDFGSPHAAGLDYQGWNLPGIGVGTDGRVYVDNFLTVFAYSNHCIGFVQDADIPFLEANDGLHENCWRHVVTPSGTDTTVVREKDGLGMWFSDPRHASWNPITDEVVRDRTTPVSWA